MSPSEAEQIFNAVSDFAKTTRTELEKYKPLLKETAALRSSLTTLESKLNSGKEDSSTAAAIAAAAVHDQLVDKYDKLGERVSGLEEKVEDLREDKGGRVGFGSSESAVTTKKRNSEGSASGEDDSAYGSEEEREKKKARTIELDVATELDLNDKLNMIAHGQESLGRALALAMDEVIALRERQDLLEERVDEHLEKLDRKIAAMSVYFSLFGGSRLTLYAGTTIPLLVSKTLS
jgi:predicted nuclease with TOPRIM domain